MKDRRLFYTVSVIGLLTAAPAMAQDAGSPAPRQTSAGSTELEEVVVTAQKRSENLQDVPLTVEAMSGDNLKDAGINNLLDLKLEVPGLTVGNEVGFATTHLRGVGSTAIGPGIENPVGLYVDGVYYASTSSSFLDFLNVDNVQVLKGPQGTLFGRNATGGLIQVTTKDPSQDTRVDADIGMGNYLTGKADVYVTTGITDTLAADLAVQTSAAGEGYGKNLNDGSDIYRNDISYSIRSKWLWTPDDTTRVMLSVDYSQQRNSMDVLRGPPGTNNLAFLSNRPAPPSNPWDTDVDDNPFFQNKEGGFALRVEQQFDFANVTDIAAYRQSATRLDFDLDNTAEPYEDAYLHTQENQFSEELQFSSKADSALKWTSGFYYFHSFSQYDPSHVVFDPNPALSPGFASLSVYSQQVADSFAGYGQATATVLPATNLTLGFRYTYETHSLSGQEPIYLANGVIIANTIVSGLSRTFEAPTWRVALDHHLTDDVLLYASVSTGFKSGGYNTQTLTDPPYQPEKLTAYEVGLKGDFLDHRLRADLSGFHYDYKDIQVQKVEAATTGIINGADASINGADLDLRARVTQDFTLTGSAEYLDATFGSFPNAPLSDPVLSVTTPVTTGSATGHQLPYASHWAFTVAGNYAVELEDSSLLFNVTANHVGGYFTEPDNVIRQSPYTKLDAFVTWQPTDGEYGVRLWAKNLTNVASFSNASTLENGLHQSTFEPPRTYGVTLSYHFAAAPAAAPAEPPPPPPPATPAPVAKAPEAQRQFQVFFDFDKSDITDAAAKIIQAASDAIKAGNVVQITVTGHTDTVGSAKYNQALSERRAAAVKAGLVSDGVQGTEITTIGVGKTGLLVPTADGVREPQNRRAEIVLQ